MIFITKYLMDLVQKLNSISVLLYQSRVISDGFHYCYHDVPDASKKYCDLNGWEKSDGAFLFYKDKEILWVRTEIEIPDEYKGISTIGSQIRIITVFQAPIEVFVNGSLVFKEDTWSDFKNPEIILTDHIKANDSFSLAIKITPSQSSFYKNSFNLEKVIESIDDIQYDIVSFANELLYIQNFKTATTVLQDIIPELLSASESVLKGELKVPVLYNIIKDVRNRLECVREEAKSRTVHLVGHAHIDMNWLWDMDETIDLIRRDFKTMCDIMDENPDFKFSQSQCATYDIAKNNHPEVFGRVKEKIENGNWDTTASSWVEGDLHMASGESISRHILYSKQYLKENFNTNPKIMWCPDTFGHCANLPQILKKGGIDDYFFMRGGIEYKNDASDNLYYGMHVSDVPFFKWKGIDGSEIFAYNASYNADMDIGGIMYYSNRLWDMGLKNTMFVYGTGDHGGGPTRRDVKRAKLASQYPTTPDIRFSRTDEFFNAVKSEDTSKLAYRTGEFDIIFPGCFTTHSDIKRLNRVVENSLYTAEYVASIASLYGYTYPLEIITNCWQMLLFNQFHDILGGCAKKPTYIYAAEQLNSVLDKLSQIIKTAITFIKQHIKCADLGKPVFLCNQLFTNRNELVELDLNETGFGNHEELTAYDSKGNELDTQISGNKLIVSVRMEPSSKEIIYVSESKRKKESGIIPVTVTDDLYFVETVYYHAQIKRNSGEIVTLYDKKAKKYISRAGKDSWRPKNGGLNKLVFYKELPETMSAWTIADVYEEKTLAFGADSFIKEDGALRKVISVEHKVENSVIKQDIVFRNDSPVISFITNVEWNEIGEKNHGTPCLSVRFFPDIHATFGMYEVPFAAIKRQNKEGTVPALMFSAVSDGNNGFALLNNAKYGHKINGNQIELFLIRSGWEPDLTSDVGHHDFTYEIYPFAGNVEDSEVFSFARQLNMPLIVDTEKWELADDLIRIGSFVNITSNNGKNVVVTAFKRTEDDKGFLIRLFEAFGTDSEIVLSFGLRLNKAFLSDINESLSEEIVTENDQIIVKINAYEIKSIVLYFDVEQ